MQRGLGPVQALQHFRAAWTVDPAHPQHGRSYPRALVLAGDLQEARRVHADAHAIARAADLPRLAALRQELRDRVRGSPLFDAPRFARNLDDAIWGMWAARRLHR
jgi:hypothetical protein